MIAHGKTGTPCGGIQLECTEPAPRHDGPAANGRAYPAVARSRNALGKLLPKDLRPTRLALRSRRRGRRCCLCLLLTLRRRPLRCPAQLLCLGFGGGDLHGMVAPNRHSIENRSFSRAKLNTVQRQQGKLAALTASPPLHLPHRATLLPDPPPSARPLCQASVCALTRCFSRRKVSLGAAAGSPSRTIASTSFSSSPPSLMCKYLWASGARLSRGSSGHEVSRSCSVEAEANTRR